MAAALRTRSLPVRILRFENLDDHAAYDGIWACASLLHVPAASLDDILARIHRALRPGGIFTASFKAGTGEGHDQFGRYYNYPTPAALRASYSAARWDHVSIDAKMGSGYDNKPTEWLWVTGKR